MQTAPQGVRGISCLFTWVDQGRDSLPCLERLLYSIRRPDVSETPCEKRFALDGVPQEGGRRQASQGVCASLKTQKPDAPTSGFYQQMRWLTVPLKEAIGSFLVARPVCSWQAPCRKEGRMTLVQMSRGEWWRLDPLAVEIKALKSEVLKLQFLVCVLLMNGRAR